MKWVRLFRLAIFKYNVYFVILNQTIEFFTNSPQHKNANIANFVLVVPFKIN